jgi:hypothetical protein
MVAACTFILSLPGMTGTVRGAFGDEVSAALSLSTATLEAPTLVTAAPGTCVGGVGDAIVVNWTAPTTPAVAGYEVLRATTSAGPYSPVTTLTGRAVETYTDTPLSFATTYHYVLRSLNAEWRSAETVPVSRTTRSPSCL